MRTSKRRNKDKKKIRTSKEGIRTRKKKMRTVKEGRRNKKGKCEQSERTKEGKLRTK